MLLCVFFIQLFGYPRSHTDTYVFKRYGQTRHGLNDIWVGRKELNWRTLPVCDYMRYTFGARLYLRK